MKYCIHCGKELTEGTKFCSSCGSPVQVAQPRTETVAAQPRTESVAVKTSVKYCTHCGKELLDEAVICVGCGCAVGGQAVQTVQTVQTGQIVYDRSVDGNALLNTLSQRLNTNGIIWLVIGILQIIGGIFWNWFLLIVGALNILSSIQDMRYSKTLLENPKGIVKKFEPLSGPIFTLVYNLVFGGVIGVVGSIYYFVAIRNYVMENKQFFAGLDAENG